MENEKKSQKKDTKEEKKKIKKRGRYSFIKPHPKKEIWNIKALYDMLPSHLSGETEVLIAPVKFAKLQQSLDKHGYDTEQFNHITVRKFFKFRITDGKKRILLIYSNNPRAKVEIIVEAPLERKVRNKELKEEALRNARKNTNSKNRN